MTNPTDTNQSLRHELEHIRNEVDYILDDDVAGEVRVTYFDGRSEIKDAKTLLSDDIMRVVEGVINRLIEAEANKRVIAELEAFYDKITIYGYVDIPASGHHPAEVGTMDKFHHGAARTFWYMLKDRLAELKAEQKS